MPCKRQRDESESSKKLKQSYRFCPPHCKRAGKQKYSCFDCYGSALCKFPCVRAGKGKRFCVDCGGGALCKEPCKRAGKQKSRCSDCCGRSLCKSPCPKAGKEKKLCLNCGGSALCKEPCLNAGKQKVLCSDCNGVALCKEPCILAGKQKALCQDCNGSSLCKQPCQNAGREKQFCPDCGGRALCKEPCLRVGKLKSNCFSCGGSALCKEPCPNAPKRKVHCRFGCGGQNLCFGCKFTQVLKRGDLCKACNPIATPHGRVREARMAGMLESWAAKALIPKCTSWNRRNPSADPAQCGIFRPDFVFEWVEGVLILEYDEQMHADRSKRCELVRMAQVSIGYGGRPVFWIRYNPDAFKVAGITLRTSRKTREAVLLRMLQGMIGDADYDHIMTIHYVCYDNEISEDNLVQTVQFSTIQDYENWVDSVAPA